MQFHVSEHGINTGARLFVCSDVAQLQEQNARILAKNLDDKRNLVTAHLLNGQDMQAVAVGRVLSDDMASLQKNAREMATWAQQHEVISVDLTALTEIQAAKLTEVLVVALGEAVYRFDSFKNKENQNPAILTNVYFIYENKSIIENALESSEALLFGVNLCKDLGNTPANVCTPTYLAQTAASEAQKLGASAKILGRDYIETNMPSFWAVAKGSVQEPQLLELSYSGAVNKEAAPIVLVGKGLTFDSGGISIKPGEAMDEMKFDMCGAATVIGTFMAAVKAKLPLNLRVVVATCENMPDGGASKPSDVVKTMNGTFVENLNTDAEGRLVLCDALTYAEQFNPRAVIDVATLTGACIIALGHVSSGLYSNQQDLADELLAASREINDKAWQMPLFDEYKEQLKSNFADMQNIGGRPAGSITAATFLAHFAQKYHWAHLDVAGTAFKSGKDKGATGRPVPLLFQYLKNQTAQ